MNFGKWPNLSSQSSWPIEIQKNESQPREGRREEKRPIQVNFFFGSFPIIRDPISQTDQSELKKNACFQGRKRGKRNACLRWFSPWQVWKLAVNENRILPLTSLSNKNNNNNNDNNNNNKWTFENLLSLKSKKVEKPNSLGHSQRKSLTLISRMC